MDTPVPGSPVLTHRSLGPTATPAPTPGLPGPRVPVALIHTCLQAHGCPSPTLHPYTCLCPGPTAAFWPSVVSQTHSYPWSYLCPRQDHACFPLVGPAPCLTQVPRNTSASALSSEAPRPTPPGPLSHLQRSSCSQERSRHRVAGSPGEGCPALTAQGCLLCTW